MSKWKIIPDINLYFITTTIVDWQYVFTSDKYFQILIDSIKFCMNNKDLHLHGYVIMPNHAHYITSTDGQHSLSDIMRDMGTFTSRAITRLLEEERRGELLNIFRAAAEADNRGNIYKVWQDGFHPIALESENFFNQKLAYIHDNPVRKGYVEQSEHWKYSSARNYILNDHSIIKVELLL
jgi:REP element-mobilizing transposase RayT